MQELRLGHACNGNAQRLHGVERGEVVDDGALRCSNGRYSFGLRDTRLVGLGCCCSHYAQAHAGCQRQCCESQVAVHSVPKEMSLMPLATGTWCDLSEGGCQAQVVATTIVVSVIRILIHFLIKHVVNTKAQFHVFFSL